MLYLNFIKPARQVQPAEISGVAEVVHSNGLFFCQHQANKTHYH